MIKEDVASFFPFMPVMPGRMDRAWAEINLSNLRHNALAIRDALPDGCELMAVIKANAYGHGDIEAAACLSRVGVRAFAVATIDEAIRLRRQGIEAELLILGYTEPRRAPEIAHYRLTQTVVDGEHAQRLNASGQSIAVHLKVDTGMHRLGESCQHAAEIASIFQYEHLDVQGIYTHLCVADSLDGEDVAFTKWQIQRFYRLLDDLAKRGLKLPKTHIQSSYGLLNHPELECDYARIGIALYGALSSPNDQTILPIDLRPVLALKARVALVRTIPAGERVGYGRQFVARRETRMAVLSIGYADGLPRNLADGGGAVLLHGCRAPMIGRICMDQMMVDVTGLPDIKQGDIATLIGRDGREEISAEQAARAAGTITNELFSRLSGRLERVYWEEESA